jgi:hypothetical protein
LVVAQASAAKATTAVPASTYGARILQLAAEAGAALQALATPSKGAVMEVAGPTMRCRQDQTLHTLAVAEAARRLTEERTAVMVALAVAALEQVPIEQTQQPAVQT